MDPKSLRKKYKEFIFKSYSYKTVGDNLELTFEYLIKPGIKFVHKVVINNVGDKFTLLDREVLDYLVFHIGLVEIPSYWKTTCSPVIKIEAGKMDNWQSDWWKKLYMNGMMQYFFENNIDFRGDDFLQIASSGSEKANKKAEVFGDKVLIPVGGGKDSAVTLSIIEKSGVDFGTLVIDKATVAAHQISHLSKSKNIVAERKLDLVKIIELNKSGYLNGHVPYSASLYFISLLIAYIFDYTEILFSNENSSNEGNVIYKGVEVNHQYSKTLEFEKDFDKYNKEYLSNINLFSFLRPLNELQISKIFSKFEKYFTVIRSCNIGQARGIWCGECPKCLSTFILLYPFLGPEKTIGIFGKDLFLDKSLNDLLFELIDENKVKPFECVGTRLELKVAMNMAIKIYANKEMPILLQTFKNSKLYKKDFLNKSEKDLLSSFSDNNMPKKFAEMLAKEL